MEFNVHPLSAELAPYIAAVFHFKGFIPDHSIERVVPTGHVFILFELDNMTRYVYENDTLKPLQSFEKCWVSGTHRQHISISAHQDSEMLVIQFNPGAFYPFLHVPGMDIAEKVIPGTDILNGALLPLREQIYQATDLRTKFALAEEWLLQRFDEEKLPPPELLDFLRLLEEKPATTLNELIDSYPYSQKQLILHFHRHIGIAPKYYQRILKFQRILQQIHRKESIKWADVAYECGYSDQAHFIHEFRHFSGFGPAEFVSNNHHEELNFFPLDKQG